MPTQNLDVHNIRTHLLKLIKKICYFKLSDFSLVYLFVKKFLYDTKRRNLKHDLDGQKGSPLFSITLAKKVKFPVKILCKYLKMILFLFQSTIKE